MGRPSHQNKAVMDAKKEELASMLAVSSQQETLSEALVDTLILGPDLHPSPNQAKYLKEIAKRVGRNYRKVDGGHLFSSPSQTQVKIEPVPETNLLAVLQVENQGLRARVASLESDLADYLAALTTMENEKAELAAKLEAALEAKVVAVAVPAPAPAPEAQEDKYLHFPPTPALGKVMPNYEKPNWYDRMEKCLDAGRHVAIAGPPGIGKSTGPEQYFASRGQPFVVVNGDGGFRRKDMEGSKDVAAGSTFFQVAEFATAAINGWGVILNEVNAADPDALLYINGILEVPHMVNINGVAYPVHKDFKLVVTYNPGLAGTKPLPQSFMDRFFPIRLDFPTMAFLRRLVSVKTGCRPTAPYMERLLKYAFDCNELSEAGKIRYQISPRRLFDAVFLMENGYTDVEMAIKHAIVDVVDNKPERGTLMALVTTSPNNIKLASKYA